jgi:hypothetical protein
MCAARLCAENDRSALARNDSALYALMDVPMDATVLLDGGATCGALTTTLLFDVDPEGIGGGPECVHSEDVLCSPIATFILTLHFITPLAIVDCNTPSVDALAGRGRGARDVIKDDFGGKLPSGRPQTSASVRVYPENAVLPADGFLPSADAVKIASARTQ